MKTAAGWLMYERPILSRPRAKGKHLIKKALFPNMKRLLHRVPEQLGLSRQSDKGSSCRVAMLYTALYFSKRFDKAAITLIFPITLM
jgi:hypothetical protein